jgi:hypothetical protein
MGWFNAGSDQKVDKPDFFGCVQLPSIECCFGVAESVYGQVHRKQLVDLLRDERRQVMPWPASLKATFNLSAVDDDTIFGSPMLDAALGQVDAMQKVFRTFANASIGAAATGKGSTVKGRGGKKSQSRDDSMQLDSILPPEKPTSWIQCEECKKWRRVPWHVDAESLSDIWTCTMNTWDPEGASCEISQDSFDPATENTLDYQGSVKTEQARTVEDMVIGTWRDVFCIKNKVYYEAQIKRIKNPTAKQPKHMVSFHYRGWSSAYDEWIAFDSDRVAPHHLYTNPDTTDPREQEMWQGREPVEAIVRTAFTNRSSKKRKSASGSKTSTSPKKRERV